MNWIINLPLAPWHRGFFERLVKSAKTLLLKQLENSRLNYEELQFYVKWKPSSIIDHWHITIRTIQNKVFHQTTCYLDER